MPVLNNIIYSDLFIEVTRRCNMSCRHCLRGHVQNIDISLESIDVFLSKLSGKCFRRIVFTGGEPSLNVDAIKFTLDKVKQYNIHIWLFEIITNGYNISDAFVDICNEWIDFCPNKGIVLLSDDSFHKKPSVEDLEKLQRIKITSTWEVAKFPILDLGNAKDNNLGERKSSKNFFNFRYFKNNLIYKDKLLLTCTNNILCDCDYSYGNEAEFLLCSLSEFSGKIIFDIVNKIGKSIPEVQFDVSLFSISSWIDYLESNNLV